VSEAGRKSIAKQHRVLICAECFRAILLEHDGRGVIAPPGTFDELFG
jgi:hypothetical protein